LYPVIGCPFATGAFQSNMTLSATTDVVGGEGFSGTAAHKIETSSLKALYPNPF
jgi:hypothetical protein